MSAISVATCHDYLDVNLSVDLSGDDLCPYVDKVTQAK